jgi:hypothetical protein
MEGLAIRPERDADHPVIAHVVRAAFAGHPAEVASFVERIRASRAYVPELALVLLPALRLRTGDPARVHVAGYAPEVAGRIVYPAAFDALAS